MRLVNETLMDTFRGWKRCEYCREQSQCVAGHIYTRGAGRVDIPENLCSLCVRCESSHHDGNEPTVKTMEVIAALRLGIMPDSIYPEVCRIRRLPQEKDSTPKPLQKKPKKKLSAWAQLAKDNRKKNRGPNKGMS